mgnify:CR=1 FL=1
MREIQAPALPEGYVDCTYRREQRALVGTWKARVLLRETPSMGQGWSIPGIMEGGIVTSADRVGTTEDGRVLWDLAGYDGGFRLMKSPPLPHELTNSSLGGVIREIAGVCGVQADVTLAGEIGVDARSLASGQTAGNVLLDLAAIGGGVAFMTPAGALKVAPPRSCGTFPCGGLRLDDVTRRSLDLDGYASGVVVILGRRGKRATGSGDDSPGGWSSEFPEEEGETPSGDLTEVSRSGTTFILGGVLMWRYRILLPIEALSYYEARLFLPGMGITKTITATYGYDVRSSVVVSGDQEQRVWTWGMTTADSVEVSDQVVSYYDAESGASASETVRWSVRQALRRTYDADLTRILSEEVDTQTVATGQAAPADAPPQSSRRERSWIWDDEHGYRGLAETESLWEERDVGMADTVRAEGGGPCTFTLDGGERYLLLPGHQTTTQVKRVRRRQTDEVFDDEGKCVTRIERETDDNGVADMLARGLFGNLLDKGNQDAKIAMAWLKSLPQQGSLRVSQMPGSSSLSTEVSTLTQPGKRIREPGAGTQPGGGTGWTGGRYVEGSFGADVCPFLLSDQTCGVLSDPVPAVVQGVAGGGDPSGWTGGGVQTASGAAPSWQSGTSKGKGKSHTARTCPKLQGGGTPGYENCSRYKPFRYLAGQTSGNPGIPVIGMAGGGGVWLEKELFVNEDLADDKARIVAQKIAGNLLSVRSVSRGLVETVTVPLDERVHPDGGILAVEHDYGNLRTTITYRPADASPPEYLMLLSTSATAANVFARESVGKGRSAMGQVVDVRPDRAVAVVGGRPVSCTSAVRVRRGDNALVFLPPGSVSNGIIQAVMR